jgi:cyanate permease
LLTELIVNFGWRTGYFALSLLALLPLPFVLFGISDNSVQPLTDIRKTAFVDDGKAIFRNWVFWAVGLAFAAVAIAVSALIVHMVPLLRDAGMTPIAAARTASIIGFGVLAGRLITGWLIDRFFAPYVAATLFLATMLGCLLLLFGGVALIPISAALIGLSLGAEADLIAYLTAQYFSMARYAFVYSIIYTMFLIGAAAGPALAGKLYHASGNYTSTVWTVVCLLTAGSLVILRLPRFEISASQTGATH